MGRTATVTDVAQVAGVSRQTVSNVLNAPHVVRADTRERVEQAIATLGYRPHAAARRLRTRQSATIGVRLDPVAGGISGAVLDVFLHGLVGAAERRGLRVLVFTAVDADDEIRQAERLIDSSDVDSFVLTATVADDPRASWLAGRGVPFVTFGRPWGHEDPARAPHPWVDVDGRSGVARVTGSLRQLGHRHVGFVGWPAGSGQGDERMAGWRSVVAASDDAGQHAADALSTRSVDDVAAARQAAERLVADQPQLSALVCASDTLALGAHLAVGDRLPVVGFDDTPVAAAVGFSSVRQPLARVAADAIDLLTDPSGRLLAPTSRHRLREPDVVWRLT